MLEKYKKRLIHFQTKGPTEGDIIQDFVAARLKKARSLRRVIHACFYIQIACAVACGAFAVYDGNMLLPLIMAAVSVLAAFLALGKEAFFRASAYVTELICAAVCFVLGQPIGSGVMLFAAFSALLAFILGYLRDYLLNFSPIKLTENDYDYIGERPIVKPAPPPPPPPKPITPAKTEMQQLAEQFTQIIKNANPK